MGAGREGFLIKGQVQKEKPTRIRGASRMSSAVTKHTCSHMLPPLIISTQFHDYIITAWISSLRFGSCSFATLGKADTKWPQIWHGHRRGPSAPAGSPGPKGSSFLPLEQYWAENCPMGSRNELKHLLSDVCMYYWLSDHCMDAFHCGFTKIE